MINFEETADQTTAQRAGRERVMEIIVFLLAEIRQNKQLTEIDLKPLTRQGFSQSEISTAFSWLFDKIASSSLEHAPIALATTFTAEGYVEASRNYTEGPFRVYHDAERSIIAVDAQGYLLQLRELGLLADNELEMVIDRIMMSGVPAVSLSEMKELVASMVFDFDDSTRVGSRMMLNASDRVQ
jgi:uncharacterized protein Smg (DUF494 family)